MRTLLLLDEPLSDRARLAADLAALGFEALFAEDPARPAEVLLTVTRPVDAALLARHPGCRLVCVAFTGFDHVDRAAALARGVAVCNVPEYATGATAELAFGLALALLRDIPNAHARTRRLEWRPAPGRELAGKSVGIAGTGRIGAHAARLFRAAGCRVLGWSRRENPEFPERVPTLGELCERADVLSLHLPLTAGTRGILGAAEIARMRPDALLVNTARGALVDARALHAALAAGRLGGAALDVFEREPFAGDPPFHELENVILLPHLGFRTGEALERRWQTTLANLEGFLSGAPRNLVA